MADTFIIYDESDDELAGIGATAAIALLGLDADLATFSLPANTTISAFGATIVDDANAAAVIATLGLDADLPTLSLPASTTITAFGASLIDDAAASNARTTLEVSYASSAEINTGTEALKVISPDSLEGSNPAVKGLYINAIRGAELAPAITDANYTTDGSVWKDPVAGGILDKFGDGYDSFSVVTPMGIVANDILEVTITIVNSPTTGTFVDSGAMYLAVGGVAFSITSVGTTTRVATAINTDDFNCTSEDDGTGRFGISAISVNKLTEGNLTMDGGQVKAQTFTGNTPGYAFDGYEDTGFSFAEQDWGSPATLIYVYSNGVVVGYFWEIESSVGLTVGGAIHADTLSVYALPTASNDTTAEAAGVEVGGFYRTNADPSVVCVRTA
jgi:hypothetical protein